MVLFVILYCFAQSEVRKHRTVILAVRQSAEPLDDSLRRHPLGARERHAAVCGRHERHHRGRGDSGGAAEGAPHALSNAQRAAVDLDPHRHHVAAGGAPDHADAIRLVVFFVEQNIARMEEMVFNRLAVEPAGAVVAELVVLVHIVKVRAESRVRRSTMPGKTDRTYSSSSLVVCLPSVNRILPCASSALCPSAKSTCEGCRSYAEQAEPVDASTRCRSSMSRIDSPSMCGTEIWILFGSRLTGWPLSIALGIFLSRRPIKKSRKAPRRADSAVRRRSALVSAAAKPTISGTLSVPARRCCSCSPPTMSGIKETPFFL